jgi:hypothetical protein
MRWIWTFVTIPFLVATLLAAPATDERAAAEAILDKAIKAVGGQDKLTQLTSYVLKLKQKPTPQPGKVGLETIIEISYEYPDHERCEFTGAVGRPKSIDLRIINGDKGWISSGGTVTELSGEKAKYLKEEPFDTFPVRQLPLYKGKGYKLAMLGESKLEDKKVIGVKVSSEGKDWKLYFDKDTGLLRKREYEVSRAVPAGAGEDIPKRILVEVLYEDYKETGGVKYPSKTTNISNGRGMSEVEIIEFKAVDKFDEKTFAKPE